MRKRELERRIIALIRNRELYGYELRRLLATQGEGVQLGYLYRTLQEMVSEGLIEGELQPGKYGPRRRQYRLMEKGRKELGKIFEEATELIHDFYEEYVLDLPPKFFSERFDTMMREVYSGRESVAFVISEPLSHVHRNFLERISRRQGGKRTYLIKPSNVRVDLELPSLTILDGTFDDLPLKDKSLDGMVVVDIQDAINLKACAREFRRVLGDGGVMCGCAPFMGLGGASDPLEVGEFMKKMKSSLTGRPYLEKETIRKVLNENFDYVDQASLGFLTAFLSGLNPTMPRASTKPIGAS